MSSTNGTPETTRRIADIERVAVMQLVRPIVTHPMLRAYVWRLSHDPSEARPFWDYVRDSEWVVDLQRTTGDGEARDDLAAVLAAYEPLGTVLRTERGTYTDPDVTSAILDRKAGPTHYAPGEPLSSWRQRHQARIDRMTLALAIAIADYRAAGAVEGDREIGTLPLTGYSSVVVTSSLAAAVHEFIESRVDVAYELGEASDADLH